MLIEFKYLFPINYTQIMKITKITLISALLASTAFGTSITFNVEELFVFDGQTSITKDNSNGYTALGVFGDLSALDFSSAAAIESGLSSFTQNELNFVPSVVPIQNVWSEAVNSGSVGNTANLIIFDGTNLAAASSWGVVTTSFVTQSLGAESVGFATTNKWDSAHAGTLTGSSFTLAAVPEPSSYAVLAGLLSLSCVMVRRRR